MGKCMNQENVVNIQYSEPYKMFLNGENSSDEKIREWYKFIRGTWINAGVLSPKEMFFLPDHNQFKCE